MLRHATFSGFGRSLASFVFGLSLYAVGTYEVGESLSWRLDKRGSVPAWAYSRDGSANVGRPIHSYNLVIRESKSDIYATTRRLNLIGGEQWIGHTPRNPNQIGIGNCHHSKFR